MINGFLHVGLATGRLDRMVEFYCKNFGFEVVSRFAWKRGAREIDAIIGLSDSAATQAMLRNGSAMIEIFEYSAPPGKPVDPDRPLSDHGITHFSLSVSDIDAEYERLRAAGMQFFSPPFPPPGEPTPDGVRVVSGRDPDGNVIELMEMLGPPASGERTWN